MTNESRPTFAAVLTPPARGAIATISVDGPQAVSTSCSYFHSIGKIGLADANVGRILVGTWKEDEQDPGEELVVARVDQQRVEIHCHGGMQASQRILQHLSTAGCEVISWQEWIANQEEDAIIAEARLALPHAATQQAALHLLDQCQGALSREINDIVKLLEQTDIETARKRIESVLQFAQVGKGLTQPWSIVLAGPPNVGKSSLLNAIVGYERAIVLDMPGTTRDVLHATTALDGWPVQFSDTAGIRLTADELEEAGIAKAKAAMQTADLVVVLHDAANLRPDELDESLRQLPSALHVVNKIDLTRNVEIPEASEMLGTSAVTGDGIAELISTIVAHLIPDLPEPGQPIPFTPRQVTALQESAKLLDTNQAEAAMNILSTLLRPQSKPNDD
ncbi:GTP-binding protein [bacterium]|nr:GTP-binding protein [bacterium]